MIPKLSWGADFAGLVSYLVENRDHEVLDLAGVSSIETAAHEMASVAALNSRATRKLLHMSLSAAIEDCTLSRDKWMHCVIRLEDRLGLGGHQRVTVRHRDKSHDHVHVFWCAIDLNTGRTPPKLWFLRKGCAVEGVGPQALTAEQYATIPVQNRALHSYDFIALRRCQHECRTLEAELGLRQLSTPIQSAQARSQGDIVAPIARARKREERTGTVPLLDRAVEIRDALDAPDWPSKQIALAALRLEIEPVFRDTKNGLELRGVTIVDAEDRANRLKASGLTTPTHNYGWRQLETRHCDGARSLETWWMQREEVVEIGVSEKPEPQHSLKAAYDLMVQRHALQELQKAKARKALRARQSAERRRAMTALKKRRGQEARQLPSSLRRAFYTYFSRSVRAVELFALAREHKAQAAALSRVRKPTWLQYAEGCADAGQLEAAMMLQVRKPIRSFETAVRQPRQAEIIGPVHEAAVSLAPIMTVESTKADDVSDELLFQAYKMGKGKGR